MNKTLKYNILQQLIALVFICSFGSVYSQNLSDAQIKAGFTYQFAKFTDWPKTYKSDTFKIAFYGEDQALYNAFKTMETLKIEGLPVKIIPFTDVNNIPKSHIIYVCFISNFDVGEIFRNIQKTNSLLITDRYELQRYVMINFVHDNENKVSFEVNKQNINKVSLEIQPKLLFLGGTEIDVRELYVETEKSLQNERQKVESIEKELLLKQNQLEDQNLRLKHLQLQVQKQEDKIKELQNNILLQTNALNEIINESEQQRQILKQRLDTLHIKEKEIVNKETLILEKQYLINTLSQNVSELESTITGKEQTIEKQDGRLKQQQKQLGNYRNFIILLFIVFLLVLSIAFLIYRLYRTRIKINKALHEKNEKINKQNDEILSKSQQLEITNAELEKLSIVAQKTSNAVMITDADGYFEWINEGFVRLNGYTLEEFRKEKGTNLIEASTNKKIRQIIEQCKKQKTSTSYETLCYNKSFEKFWVHTTLTPILDKNDKVIKLVAIDTDISKLKDFEEKIVHKNAEIEKQSKELQIHASNLTETNNELAEQKNKLEKTLQQLKSAQNQLIEQEKMASLGQLTAGIAHEINNPINFINASIDGITSFYQIILELLEKYSQINNHNLVEKLAEIKQYEQETMVKELAENVSELFDNVKFGVSRTTEIVKGLRTFSRLDEDELKLADINQVLNNTIILVRNQSSDRIKFIRNYAKIPQIYCYPGKLNQVFLNIMVNAIQAIENKGEISLSSELLSEEGKNLIQIKITDTGPGIPDEIKEHIFEPFYTTKDVGEGTGLGLSISYSIIEKHQGSIKFYSKPGKGTTFVIKIPIEIKK